MCLKCFLANLLHFRKYIVYQVFEKVLMIEVCQHNLNRKW